MRKIKSNISPFLHVFFGCNRFILSGNTFHLIDTFSLKRSIILKQRRNVENQIDLSLIKGWVFLYLIILTIYPHRQPLWGVSDWVEVNSTGYTHAHAHAHTQYTHIHTQDTHTHTHTIHRYKIHTYTDTEHRYNTGATQRTTHRCNREQNTTSTHIHNTEHSTDNLNTYRKTLYVNVITYKYLYTK